MVDTLVRDGMSVLFCIGGDGTLRGAPPSRPKPVRRGRHLAVVGIPKTIDNDLDWVERSFGFATAVEAAARTIRAAHAEARGALNGIGLVKLMGRHAGFIAANATLARPDVNLCLVPEVPFTLDGEGGVIDVLADRLADAATPWSWSPRAPARSCSLPRARTTHLATRALPISAGGCETVSSPGSAPGGIRPEVKYLDPSYEIRALPANAYDAAFCLSLGQIAAHAGMAGKTDVVVGYHHHHFTHVPIAVATADAASSSPTRTCGSGCCNRPASP